MFGSWGRRGVWWGRRRGGGEGKGDSRTDDLCELAMRSGGFCRRLGMGFVRGRRSPSKSE